jgi:hypothetical protein
MRLKYLWMIWIVAFLLNCCEMITRHVDDKNWIAVQSEHFIFHYRPNSLAERNIAIIIEEMENNYREIVIALNVNYSGVVNYYLYNSNEASSIGVIAGGFSDNSFETIRQTYDGYPLGKHELVHIISFRAIGIAFLRLTSEGLANAVDGTYGGKPISDWMREYVATGALIPVREMVENSEKYDEARFYPQSGFFVQYLVNRFGIDKFKVIFRASHYEFYEIFQATYGIDLDTLANEYFAYLRNGF